MYHCPICDGTDVRQEETSLWHLNKERTIENSSYMNDFYWCGDCDDKITHVVVKEDSDD